MKIKLQFTIFLLLSILSVHAQNIAQWRGVNRDGIYNEKNLMKSWPEGGPKLLWSYESIGSGYGSPVITSDRIFVNGESESISQLFAFDLKGNLLWKSPNGQEFMGQDFSAKFPGARSTPTIINGLIYACSGNGRIACFDYGTGKEKWAVDMVKDLQGLNNYFGYSESLLIEGDIVYCYPGGPNNNVAALNRFTGKTVWTSKALADTVSFCSPMIIKLAARDVFVTFSVRAIFGLDAKTGELLWSQSQENVKNKQQCNTPVYSDGFLYYVAGDGNGAVKLQLSPDGKSIKEIWRYSDVKNNFNGFVKLNDYLYSPHRAQKIKCIDVKTGQLVDTVKVGKGSLIAADGMLFCYSDNGIVNLVKVDGPKMEITGKVKIDKGTQEHFAHPAIDNGVLYIRHGKTLMAYDIRDYK